MANEWASSVAASRALAEVTLNKVLELDIAAARLRGVDHHVLANRSILRKAAIEAANRKHGITSEWHGLVVSENDTLERTLFVWLSVRSASPPEPTEVIDAVLAEVLARDPLRTVSEAGKRSVR